MWRSQSLQRGHSSRHCLSHLVCWSTHREQTIIIFFTSRCPSWRNQAGSLITAKSTCQPDGSWSDPTPFPPGPLYFPPTLNTPDILDMGCNCQPLNITYNPNLEAGTEFHCSPEMDWDNLPAKIETNTQCNLLCDKMLIDIIECKEGIWTGRPDLGFWCNKEKESVGLWLEDKTKE